MKKMIGFGLKLVAVVCMLVGAFAVSGEVQAANQYAKDGFYYEKEYGKVYITGYYGSSTTAKIPAEIDGGTVVKIVNLDAGGSMGNTFDRVEHIEMPDTITEVKKIDNWPPNENLKTVRLSAKLDKIDYQLFYGNTNLSSVTNGVGVKEIGTYAFTETGLKSIDFPNLEVIGNEVFKGCLNLESINCPKLEDIGSDAFKNCSKLRYVRVSPKLKRIGSSAFLNDRNLTSFKVPTTCTEIATYAFAGTGLREVSIPSTVRIFDGGIFQNCENLESAVLHTKGTVWGGTFEGCTKLKNVDLGTGITEIWDKAFLDCTSLKSITIPQSVKRVSDYAFVGCENLTEIRGYHGTEAERFANSIGVKFTPIEPKITLSASKITLYPVSGFNKVALKVKREGTSSTIKFTSSNKSIATVSSKGTITAKKRGTVTITVICGSLKKTCRVYVKTPYVSVTSGSAIGLKLGKTTYIKAKAVPVTQIKYVSSDSRVAAVNSRGKVYAKKKGTCYIKVYIDGAYKMVKVTVK